MICERQTREEPRDIKPIQSTQFIVKIFLRSKYFIVIKKPQKERRRDVRRRHSRR